MHKAVADHVSDIFLDITSPAVMLVDAAENGVACPVNLEATHEEALSIIPLEVLELYAE